MEYFVDCFLANGVLEDRVMDEQGIPKAEEEVNKKDRDERAPRSNRCILLTGQEFLIYFKNKREEKKRQEAKLKRQKKEKKDREDVLKAKFEKTSQENKEVKAKLTAEKKRTKEVEDQNKELVKVRKQLEDTIRELQANNQSSESHQEAENSRPKKKPKANTSASASGHQIADNCDNNGQIEVNCCNNNVDRNQVLMCVNCNNFSTCRLITCQHFMNEHLNNCKK